MERDGGGSQAGGKRTRDEKNTCKRKSVSEIARIAEFKVEEKVLLVYIYMYIFIGCTFYFYISGLFVEHSREI